MKFLDFLKVRNLWKYAPKRTKLHNSKNIFRGSMSPNPPSKRMATPRVAILAPPPKKNSWLPLANPAYVHKLLLKKLFENPPLQTVDCV